MPAPQTEQARDSVPDTKDRLLEAALHLFAERGFDGVSTRQLATEAGANIAAIAYHFGGKKELYHALLARIVEETAPRFDPIVDSLQSGLAAAGTNRDAIGRVATAFVRQLVHGFLGDERMRLRAGVTLREHAHPSEAFPILYAGRLEPMQKAVSSLVAAATRTPEDAAETMIRAQAIIGQIIIFVIGREVVFRRLDWTSYTPERIDLVSETVTASVLASLGLPSIDPAA